MKGKSTIATLLTLALSVATVTVFATNGVGARGIGRAASAGAQEISQPITFSPGVIGVGRGQTASIHAVIIGVFDTERSIEAEFEFHDRDGNVLISSRQTLLSGRASSLDTRGIIAILKDRTELIPCLRILSNTSDAEASLVVPTFEVFDNATGKTQLALSCRKAGGDPN